ncbi:trifunctional dihydropteroate synthetase [Saitoella coloradoensis]
MSMNSEKMALPQDVVYVKSLTLKTITGPDNWQRHKPTPVTLSIECRTSVALAGSTDHLPYSLHYGTMCKLVSDYVENGDFKNLEALAEGVAGVTLGEGCGAEWVRVRVEKPRALLRADAAGLEIVRRKDGKRECEDMVFIDNLRLVTIIGVNPWERVEKQNVFIQLELYKPIPALNGHTSKIGHGYDFRTTVHTITDHIEQSDYKTVEAFVTAIAKIACLDCGVQKIKVTAEKPSALTFAYAAGVTITREASFFASAEKEGSKAVNENGVHERREDVYVALGANIGDKASNINAALKALEKRGIKIVQTSSLYETAPMYVTDQPSFLNGVARVSIPTGMTPHGLLNELKAVEDECGRVKTVEKGPRTVDLDIVLFGNEVVNTDDLIVPHKGMLERGFVLKPLADLAPGLAHPLTSTTIASHLSALPDKDVDEMKAYLPLPRERVLKLDPLRRKVPTTVMAILNLTTDSFSDGGKHSLKDEDVVRTVKQMIEDGAGIIDVGGQTSKPGAVEVPVEEEVERVVPAIKAIRAAGIDVPISVDTYRAQVAKAAVEAGADIVNDVSAGTLDVDMFKTMAELDVPVCLMHMRGTPETMNSMTTYEGDLVDVVGQELEARVREAEEAGVKRWNIILDPGLGFAKTASQNLELIRRFYELHSRPAFVGMPWLIGPSRKKFVGRVTGEEGDRKWGTSAVVGASVHAGADIVRVHDVKEMGMVVKMFDAVRGAVKPE